MLLIALTLLLTSCISSEEEELSAVRALRIEPLPADCRRGDELTLTVKDQSGAVVDPSELLWDCSDYSVVSVNAYGVIQCRAAGPVRVVAILKSDLSVRASTEVFVGYDTVVPAFATVKRVGQYVDGHLDAIADHALKFGLNVVSAATTSSLPIGMIAELFSKDKYQFSMMYYEGRVRDVVLYPLSDWTNETVSVNTAEITPESIHSKLLAELILDGAEMGSSYQTFREALLSLLASGLPADSVYHFNKMDQNLEYRVVIRGDFDYITNMSFYANGLLTGTGLTVQDLLKLEFGTLRENYTYQKNYDEILNVENLRVCIEYREKTA